MILLVIKLKDQRKRRGINWEAAREEEAKGGAGRGLNSFHDVWKGGEVGRRGREERLERKDSRSVPEVRRDTVQLFSQSLSCSWCSALSAAKYALTR